MAAPHVEVVDLDPPEQPEPSARSPEQLRETPYWIQASGFWDDGLRFEFQSKALIFEDNLVYIELRSWMSVWFADINKKACDKPSTIIESRLPMISAFLEPLNLAASEFVPSTKAFKAMSDERLRTVDAPRVRMEHIARARAFLVMMMSCVQTEKKKVARARAQRVLVSFVSTYITGDQLMAINFEDF